MKKDELSDVSTKSETAANVFWMLSNSKKCPHCKSPIEKNEGCNHMRCSKVCHLSPSTAFLILCSYRSLGKYCCLYIYSNFNIANCILHEMSFFSCDLVCKSELLYFRLVYKKRQLPIVMIAPKIF